MLVLTACGARPDEWLHLFGQAPCRGRSFLLLAQKKRTKENAPRNPTFISPCTACAIRTIMRNFRFARFVDVPRTN